MQTVEFDVEVWEDIARVSASVAGVEYHDHYPFCGDEETYLGSINCLDAREEMLGGLHDIVERMMSAIRYAEKELFIERAERDDDNV